MKARHLVVLLTFPGVVLHEWAHKQLCKYYRIPVDEVCYFQLDDPAGYVIHAKPKRYFHAFMISIAPVIINTIITLLVGAGIAVFAVTEFTTDAVVSLTFVEAAGVLFFGWIGISSGAHSLPSTVDAGSIWEQTRRNWYNPFVLTVIPIVLVIELLNRIVGVYLSVLYSCGLLAIGMYIGWNPAIIFTFV